MTAWDIALQQLIKPVLSGQKACPICGNGFNFDKWHPTRPIAAPPVATGSGIMRGDDNE